MKGGHKPIEDNVQNLVVKNVELQAKIETESNQARNDEVWDTKDICLTHNKLSKLPNNPLCTTLESLDLQCNGNIREIPLAFFDSMPRLQILNLSGTSLKRLPYSISKLKSLEKFILRDCDLLKELPPEIGDLEISRFLIQKELSLFDYLASLEVLPGWFP